MSAYMNYSEKAARYDWLRNGGWEVLQHPKYWENVSSFDEAVVAAMTDVAINAALGRGSGGGG